VYRPRGNVFWWPWSSEKKLIMENDVCRLYEDRWWYIIEDKVFSRLPVEYTSETKTIVNIRVEFAFLSNGYPVRVRAYYPKSEFQYDSFKVILQAFESWSDWTRKKIKEFEAFKEYLEGGGGV
jgi:hypothetical protein